MHVTLITRVESLLKSYRAYIHNMMAYAERRIVIGRFERNILEVALLENDVSLMLTALCVFYIQILGE